jgi:hypothetical protein
MTLGGHSENSAVLKLVQMGQLWRISRRFFLPFPQTQLDTLILNL